MYFEIPARVTILKEGFELQQDYGLYHVQPQKIQAEDQDRCLHEV